MPVSTELEVKVEKRVASISLLFFLLLGRADTASAQELHPKLKGGEKAIRTVLVLPPKVEIVKQGVKGTEGMIKESQEVEEIVLTVVTKVLDEKRIKLANTPFTPQALDANAELKYSLADAQNKYDALLPKLRKKPKDVAKGRFTLGDEVVKVNPDGSADALLFIRAYGVKPTTGKTALGALMLRLNVPFVSLSIGLVDSRTGEVLFFAKPVAFDDAVARGEKALYKPIAKSLKKLPNVP